MSDRPNYDPPDEFVIGGSTPPPPASDWAEEQVIGGYNAPTTLAEPDPAIIGAGTAYPANGQSGYQTYSGQYDGYEDEYYGDDYYDTEPAARQPLFWVILGVGALVMIGLLFLLFNLLGGGGDPTETGFNVSIDSPQDQDRIEIDQEFDVVVQASSSEPITAFALFVNDEQVDEQPLTSAEPGEVQRAIFKHTFEERGDYEIFVRVTAEGGATRDSDVVTIVAIEPIEEAPSSVTGTVIAVVSARVGPGDQYEVVGSLEPDDRVTIRGKTRDNEWLLVDSRLGDGLWVRRAAIEPDEALALVPVREPTATPAPTATEEPSATPEDTSTPDTSLPDLIPVGASLVDGGNTLRATIANNGGADVSGGLVVSLSQLESVTLVFDVSIAAGGTTTVDFPLTSTVTETSAARITVDPDNAVEETLEDNNAATFTVSPPVNPPELIIASVTVSGGEVTLVVTNQGGLMETSEVGASVTAGGQTNSAATQTIALANGQSTQFVVNVTGLPSGQGIAAVTVDGVQVASVAVSIP